MQHHRQGIDRILPYEILLHIFDNFGADQRLQTLCNLTLVCRVFNALTRQPLYRDLDLSTNRTDRAWNNRRANLLRTLEEEPQLCDAVRTLTFCTSAVVKTVTAEKNLLQRAKPFVQHLSLEVGESFPETLWVPLYAMNLTSFRLFGSYNLSVLPPIIRGDAYVHLQTMEIAISAAWEKINSSPNDSFPHLDLTQFPDTHGLVNLRHLKIDAPTFPIHLLMAIMARPRSLVSFTLEIAEGFYVWMHTTELHYLSALQGALALQKSTLEVITVDEWIDDNRRSHKDRKEYPDADEDGNRGQTMMIPEKKAYPRMLNLFDFPHLKKFCLHYSNLFFITAEEACDALLAPNLELIQIDMSWHDQQTTGFIEIENEHVDFLIKFVQDRQQKLDGRSKLREFHFLYYEDEEEKRYYELMRGEDETTKWAPYDCYIAAAARLEEYGVRITWSG